MKDWHGQVAAVGAVPARITPTHMILRPLCGARTNVSIRMGTIGRCELTQGHPGPHQEQRQDNGCPHQWPNDGGAA